MAAVPTSVWLGQIGHPSLSSSRPLVLSSYSAICIFCQFRKVKVGCLEGGRPLCHSHPPCSSVLPIPHPQFPTRYTRSRRQKSSSWNGSETREVKLVQGDKGSIASNDVTDKSGGEKFYSASNISISIPRLPRLTVPALLAFGLDGRNRNRKRC